MKNNKRLLSIFLAVLLSLSCFLPAHAASDTITIQSEADLIELAKNCTLDSWSQGKTILLEADLNLTNTQFTSIPIFCGTFDGQGHSITGLRLTDSGNVQGLFRYIQEGGIVKNLTVGGKVAPSDKKDTLGVLAGSNAGTITNCNISGDVQGANQIGGVVGINTPSGEIVNCTFTGSVTGEHSAGGIAGENYGTIANCSNSGSINTKNLDDSPEIDSIDWKKLNSTANLSLYMDIGGIAGLSKGTIQGCQNAGTVGYEHIGYNIGGIAGRQSGYLDRCTNTGKIYGRKDVGGIVGQLEPEVVQSFSKDFLDKLMDELDRLMSLTDQTLNDADQTSDALSEQLNQISDQAKSTKETADGFLDSMTDWANGNIDQVNELTARVSQVLDRMVPIMENAVDLMDELDDLLYQLDRAVDKLQDAVDSASDANDHAALSVSDLARATSQLHTAAAQLDKTITKIETALSDLRNALGDPEATIDALHALLSALESSPDVIDAVKKAASNATEALNHLQDSGDDLDDALLYLGNSLTRLKRAGDQADDVLSLLSDITLDVQDMIAEQAEKPQVAFQPIDESITSQGDALSDSLGDMLESADSLNALITDSTDTLLDDLRAITSQFRVITNLIRTEKTDWQEDQNEDKETRIREHFEDLSQQCNLETQHNGRISASKNEGSIYGDINVGGIIGSSGIETDFDKEEDVTKAGNYSLEYSYWAKALILSCINTGSIESRQTAVGGIAGNLDLGYITQCESYGNVKNTDGTYTGGIAGYAWGALQENWSKCVLSGKDYVGGIAGYGKIIEDCRSLATIDDGETYLGSIAGDMDWENAVLSHNFFTSETLAGIDGISYSGKAEPVSYETLCAGDNVPADFAQLQLTFRADGETIAVIPFQYGKGITSLPEIPAKKGYSASWPDLDYTHLTASQTLDAIYTPYASALTDGEELPQILVDGSFSNDSKLSYSTQPVSWTDHGRIYEGTAYSVIVSDPVMDEISYTVHYRLPDKEKHYTLWVQTADGWQKQDAEIDGSYLMFSHAGDTVTFCVLESSGSILLSVLLVLGIAALGGGGWIGYGKYRKRKAGKQAAQAAAETAEDLPEE